MHDQDFKPVPAQRLDDRVVEMDPEHLEAFRKLMTAKPLPVPTEALALLRDTAAGDTGGSVAARTFLFWLVGESDPTGLGTDGALELRRLDARHKEAALAVLTWWTGLTQSDQPVYDLLKDLSRQFPASEGSCDER